MGNFQEIAVAVHEEFFKLAEERGIEIIGINEETGQIEIPRLDGGSILVSLENLIHYYYESRDENAVNAFIDRVVDVINPQSEPEWDEAKEHLYLALGPTNCKVENPFIKEITEYLMRYFIIDTPSQAVWVLSSMLEKWGITEEQLEQQAFENANCLLANTGIEIGDVEGHPLGSFQLEDLTLNGALLLAPDFKAKVSKDFGWPVYAIIPNKVTCYFFGKEHYDYFIARIAGLVTEKYYDSGRSVTPELLELSDAGVRSICSWSNKMGQIVQFDS